MGRALGLRDPGLQEPLRRYNLLSPARKIEHLEVPRDREGEYITEVCRSDTNG
jgi:hypothetical protein